MAALNQFTVGFLAIPSVNKHLVIQLARCEYVDQRENVIAVRNSGSDKTHVALGLGLAACQRGLSVGFTTAASLVHTLVEARDERRLLNPSEEACPPKAAHHHRQAWLRAAVQDRGQATVRSLQPALRERIGPGHHQPALRRVDGGLRLGAAHRCTPGSPHSPRPHPGGERRELPPQAQQGERCSTSPGRIRQPISRARSRPHSLTHPPSLLPACLCDTSPEQLARTFTLANDLSGGTLLLRSTGMFCRRP